MANKSFTNTLSYSAAKLLGEEILPLGHVPPERRGSFRRRSHSPWRGPSEVELPESRSVSPTEAYKTTCLSRPSRSPSPKASPPKVQDYYGTTQLERRSRSPSPSIDHRRLQYIPPRAPPAPLGRGRRLPSLPGQPPPPPAPSMGLLELDDMAFTTDSPTLGADRPFIPSSEYEAHPPSSRSPSPTHTLFDSMVTRRPRLRRLPATQRPPPMAPFIVTQDTATGILEQVPLPTVNDSPTIPNPEQRSPNGINFPRVCASPSMSPTDRHGLFAWLSQDDYDSILFSNQHKLTAVMQSMY